MAVERPNILLIGSDQHRYDCTPLGGHPLIQMPAIDRIAREGVWFTHAFTPSPICVPARQSLLCGQWPTQHGGLWNYGGNLPERLFDAPTWTEGLAASGYALGYVGKWEVHPNRSPLEYGFGSYTSARDYAAWRESQRISAPLPDAERLPVLQGHVAAHWFGGVDPAPVAQTRTHWYAAQAIALLRHYANAGTPWHLRIEFEEPHLPCYPAEPFASLYPPETITPWGSFAETFAGKPYIQRQQLLSWGIEDLTWREWSIYVSRYLGMVSQIDDAIGRVLEALDALGMAEDTLVIYTTDHGDNCGGHRLIDKHYIMYEDVVHVPLAMRWPGVIRPGVVCDALVVHALDLAATACEATATSLPDGQGRSLLPFLQSETVPDWRQDVIAMYHGAQFGLYCQRMIRDRRYKYVWNPTDVDELYDLEVDPCELHNAIDDTQYTDVLRDLRSRLLAQLMAQRDPLVRTDWMQGQLSRGRKLGRR